MTIANANKIEMKEEFWRKLFPEIKTDAELEELLQKTSKLDFAAIKQEFEESYKYEETISEVFNLIFSIDESNFTYSLKEMKLKNLTYFNFIKPFILYALHLCTEQIDNNSLIHDKKFIYESIVHSTYNNSYKLFYRTLIYDVNVAKAKNILQGDTPEARFNYYVDVLLNNPNYLKGVYLEYKALTLLLFESIKNHINYFVEILSVTEQEKKQIEEYFEIDNLCEILNVELSVGDSHARGKTVGIITFTDNRQLVFKPRNMHLEKAFNNLIAYINANKTKELLDLKCAKIYTTNQYGWMEYINFEECSSEQEITRFYKRIGEYLCVLYSLNAKDFHHENLIARGEYPYLIDLEAVLHIGKQSVKNDSVQEIVTHLINDSVYSIYLLPTRTIFKEDHGEVRVLDIGGTGANTVQQSPFRSLQISENKTDNIHIKNDYSTVNIEKNNPQLNNTIINSRDYIDSIHEGFEEMYHWILQNKAAYLSIVENLFANSKCRIICKPTFMYSKLLQTSFHPDLLREPIDRKIFLNRIGLAEFIINSDNISYNEYLDLLEGDIPYFSLYAEEIELLNSKDEKVGGSSLTYNPLDAVKTKIKNLSDKDLLFQKNIIDFTFMHFAKDDKEKPKQLDLCELTDITTIDRQQYLNTAIKIGNLLLDKSFLNGDFSERTWVGLMINGKSEVFTRLSWIEHDLYKGNSGIALYLAYLGALTDDEKFKKAAIESLLPCIKILDTLDEHPHISIDIGAFTGISGVIYSLFHVGTILRDDELVQKAYDYTQYLTIGLEKNIKFEVISGSAGALGVLMSLYEKTESPKIKEDLLKKAETISEHIMENVTKLEGDKFFWGPFHENEGYTGFAHGTSGITASLVRLYKVNKNEKIKETIKKTLTFEDSLFSPNQNNWKTNFSKEAKSLAWCHGASGMLLNRGLLYKFGFEDQKIMNDLEIALDTTLNQGLISGYTFCHGIPGNLAIIYEIANIREDTALKDRCDAIFANVYESYIKEHWNQNAFRSVNIYGLMIGLAGIGYFLLKYGYDSNLPNILWLE